MSWYNTDVTESSIMKIPDRGMIVRVGVTTRTGLIYRLGILSWGEMSSHEGFPAIMRWL